MRARGERFDYVAWDLYAEVTRYYEEDRSRVALVATPSCWRWSGGTTRNRAARRARSRSAWSGIIWRTMDRIDVRYDLLPRESDILAPAILGRCVRAAARVRSDPPRSDGKHAGCWVMDLAGVEEGAGEDQKIIVRSNGTVTYVGKDIAYQMWKFGLLGRDFRYRLFSGGSVGPSHPVWTTCSSEAAPDPPAFGKAAVVYNVIDTRQSLPPARRGAGTPRARIRRAGRALDPLRVRDGRADPDVPCERCFPITR